MRRLLTLILAWSLLAGTGAGAADQIVIVQSAKLAPFEDAVRGFKEALEAGAAHRGPKKVLPVVFRSLSMAGPDGNTSLVERIHTVGPGLVLAVGTPALEELRDLQDTPVVYLLVHTPPEWLREHSNVTGVGMTIPPNRWFEAIRTTLPDRKRLGVLYTPTRTAAFVRAAEEAAAGPGFSLVTREVSSPKEVYDRLNALKDQIDGVWMLPDVGVVTPQTVETMLLFSIRQRIPVITFSERFLDMGATMALLLDFGELGRQAGEMAARLLDGARVETVPAESPARLRVRVNRIVAERLGVAFRLPAGEKGDRAR